MPDHFFTPDDLFSVARPAQTIPPDPRPDEGGRDFVSPRLRAGAVAFIAPLPGCHDCAHWRRANAATGRCATVAQRLGIDGDAHPWLTSYAYCCPAHEARARGEPPGSSASRGE